MKRKSVSKLMVNWVASFVSVVLLLSMLALPALAVVAANSVNSGAIINGQVRTPDLAGNAVTSAKIKNGQVKRGDIALGAVVSGRIADGAVTTAKIRNGHVRTADIAMGAVASGRIADGAVTSAKIRNGTITNADIAPGLNADKVDGKHASSFVENTGPQSIDGNVTATGFSYDTTKTKVLKIQAMAFNPRDGSTDYFRGSFLKTTAGGTAYFGAQAHLPDDAVIKELRGRLVDSTSGYINVELIKQTATSGSIIASTPSSDDSGWQTIIANAISEPIVDNTNSSYFVFLAISAPSGSLKIYEVEIEYEYRSSGH